MKVDFCPVLCIPKVAILQAFWGISRFVWCRKMTDIISVQILGLQLGFSGYYLPRVTIYLGLLFSLIVIQDSIPAILDKCKS